ncbi:tetratricopeptide repeat protein [Pseudochrobactrum sp. HB0163]|uniref:tetratricopeptide repeat protein n=1 Tax=Pseudochrobactrum sp. HB0163 TaxID=3450708 RepID=UPI003F6DB87E
MSLITVLAISACTGFAFAQNAAENTENVPLHPPSQPPLQPMPPAITIPDAAKPVPLKSTTAKTDAQKTPEKTRNPEVETAGTLAEIRIREQDELFEQLRKTTSAEKSHKLASRLRQSFARTGSDSLDLMLRWAETALNQARYAEAQDFIDEVMAQRPNNATVWQLRARLHLRRNELTSALKDIRQAMILEPRNFDILVNYATLLRETGKSKAALILYKQALSFYPMMKEAQDEMLKLTEAQSDTAI